jgi:tetratricopeptide (TPR) repeat protein
MLNVRDLEEQWLKYKIKSYFPYFLGALILLVILITLVIYTTQNSTKEDTKVAVVTKKQTPQEHLHVNTQVQKVITPAKVSPSKELPKIKEVTTPSKNLHVNDPVPPLSQKPQRLKPSFSFLNSLENEPVRKVIKHPKTQPVKQINTQIKPAVQEKPLTKAAPVVAQEKAEATIPKGIKIDRAKTHNEVQDIIHRFETNKNPALGLYLARYYYKMQNYEKAYNYALSTNHIDSDIEECWLIFASSQVKLGKKDAAIKTLIAYIKNSDSINAKNLLHSIRTGEFR